MAIFKSARPRKRISNSLPGILDYVLQEEKTEEALVDGINVDSHDALNEMLLTKKIWNKEGGRQYKHHVQSFPPGESISLEEAHRAGMEFAKKYYPPGFQLLIVTHKDRDHIHNHFIINSVSYVNGKKYQEATKDLLRGQKINDEICKAHGLSIIDKGKGKSITCNNRKKYECLMRACRGDYKSHLLDCACAVVVAKSYAISQEDFIRKLGKTGIKTMWTNDRKYIVFTDKLGNKFRNSNLERTFKEPLQKEDLLLTFKNNLKKKNLKAKEETRSIKTKGPIHIDRNNSIDVAALAKTVYNNLATSSNLPGFEPHFVWDDNKEQMTDVQAVEKTMAEFSDTMQNPAPIPEFHKPKDKDDDRGRER